MIWVDHVRYARAINPDHGNQGCLEIKSACEPLGQVELVGFDGDGEVLPLAGGECERRSLRVF